MHIRNFAGIWLGAVVAIFTCLPLPGCTVRGADAMNPIEIEEWKVPYGGRARDPFAASADQIWFVGQSGNYLARFTPSTAKFFKRELPDSPGPHNLIVGSDGIVWYAGNLRGYIGRYDPSSDRIEKISMPKSDVRDPHTLVFDKDERHIWFTAQGANFVGRLTLASRAVDLIPVPTGGARPYGIKLAPDGTPWAVLVGTNKLASVNREYSADEPAAKACAIEDPECEACQ